MRWAQRDSNPRHLPCKGSALPTELCARAGSHRASSELGPHEAVRSVQYVGPMTADLDRIDEQSAVFHSHASTKPMRGNSAAICVSAQSSAVWPSRSRSGSRVDGLDVRDARYSPANADRARRKRNVVELHHQPSYAVGLGGSDTGSQSGRADGPPPHEVASHGGGFPIFVEGVGCIGAVTVSGLPQRDDHELVGRGMAGRCGVDWPTSDSTEPVG